MKGGSWIAGLICLALAAAISTGCHKKRPVLSTAVTPSAPRVESTSDSEGGLPGSIPLDQLGFKDGNQFGLENVYFDYDSSALRPDAIEMLGKNAQHIKDNPSWIVQIAGHCDMRGTQEYNLALGERRALAVRNHLMQLGVSGDRMITISFGEESPADPGQDESAFAKNRRCEFNVATGP